MECTQEEFAKNLGITRSTLAKYERNELRFNSEILLKLASIVSGVTVQWILTGYPDQNPSPVQLIDLVAGGCQRPIMGMARQYAEMAEAAEKVKHASESFRGYRERMPEDLQNFFGKMPAKYTPFMNEVFTRAEAFSNRSVSCKVYDDVLVGAGYKVVTGPNHVERLIELPSPPFKPAHEYGIVKVKGDSMVPLIRDGDDILVDESTRSFSQCSGRIVVANLVEHGFGAKGVGSTVKMLRRTREGVWELFPLNPEEQPMPDVTAGQIVGMVVGILPEG